MSNTAIKVENLSKIYRLGEIGTGTISRDMERWFKTKVLKQEDSFLKIGETNDRAKKGTSDIVYSLRDINFEIEQGDAVGIIGRNGAGKSTLLKILSRVTTPTTGKINIKGRVASLLEVGTGFHPELTGRENIYLNGAILGMRKREIIRKLDEIIDFSGVERYIDTPVKRYSSGMYVRLAFAVAAHLESEILIVDEVLAVGDAEFQKKCLGKMTEVSKGEGRTVLFVSHNMPAVQSLCQRGILLGQGQLEISSNVNTAIKKYTEVASTGIFNFEDYENEHFELLEIRSVNCNGEVRDSFSMDEDFYIEMFFNKTSDLKKSYLHLVIADEFDSVIVEFDSIDWANNFFDSNDCGPFKIRIEIIKRLLKSGKFQISIGLASDLLPGFNILSARNIYAFTISNGILQRDQTRVSCLSYNPRIELVDTNEQ
jgi:lipopolysaccharide transport system ATP-binding protein